MLGTFRGAIESILVALQFFAAHVLLALGIASIMTGLSRASGALARPVQASGETADAPALTMRQRTIGDGAAKLAFALFGVAAAYFLSLGIDPAGGKQNDVLSVVSAPFITLLTAAVTYLASKDRKGFDTTSTGVAAFLATLLVSFYAMHFQKHG